MNLDGMKTYLGALLTILGAIATAIHGDISWAQAAALIVPAVLAATIRHGVSTHAQATLDGIADLVKTAGAFVKPLSDEQKALIRQYGGTVPFLVAGVLALGLGGCAGLSDKLPHAAFSLGFAGVELSVDTRPVVNMVAGAVTGTAAGVAVAGAATPTATAK